MTPQQIVGLGVRLFAIWLALSGVNYIITISRFMAPGLSGLPITYLIAVAYFVVALLLWFFPMAVSHRIVPRTHLSNTVNLNAVEAARVGCCLLGIWWLIQIGHNLVVHATSVFLGAANSILYGGIETDQKLNLLVLIVEMVFALILMFKSDAVANRLMRLPFAQTDETDIPQNVGGQKDFPEQSCHEEQQK